MAYAAPAQDRPALPEYLARKDQGKMDDEDLNSIVREALSQSVQFVDTELSTERARATEYYLGKPFGNEENGRSQVVLTEVRDAVDGMLPSLARIFFSSEHTVEFVPTRPDNVEQAAQKTDYVRHVFEEENNGFLETLSVWKDGLVRKLGIFMWGWDESKKISSYKQEGIDEQQLQALAADDTLDLTTVTKRKKDQLYDVEFKRTTDEGQAWIKCVPPEEFIFNRQARSLEEALLLGRRTDKTRGELLAMGISEKDIDEHAGPGNETDVTLKGNAEEIARRDIGGVGQVSGFGYTADPVMGTANEKILYCDILMRVDYDGDGIAELRRICTVGPTYYPVKNDPAAEKRFAVFTPYPEPHTLMGGSVADRTMDMQRINSAILRAILDGAAASVFPRTVYVEGQASVADIMNTAIGAPIRERASMMVRTLVTPFVGKDLMPLLTFGQETIERRTGRNQGTAGLDADALQSTGKEAVDAVLTGGQEQLEMMARVFAEGTLKPLFKGLGRMLQEKQPRAKLVRLRGTWTQVDPKAWDADMDVTVNVGLGTSFIDKKIATLMAVAADQENILTQMGMSNPFTSAPKFLNTRAKILALQGIKDFPNYYNELPPDWQPPPPPPPPPDPKMMAMQAESEMQHVSAMKDLAIKQDELSLKQQELALREQELALKHQDSANKASSLSFDQAFKVEELAVNTEIKKAQVEATLQQAAQAEASAQTAVRELTIHSVDPTTITDHIEKLHKSVADIQQAQAAEKPPIVVPAPAVHVPAPVVNVPAPVVHVHPPEKRQGKRKIRATKQTDGSYHIESDE